MPDFQKNPLTPNFMKIGPLGAELFHAYRRTNVRTDTTKISLFRNFANTKLTTSKGKTTPVEALRFAGG
jgi:hypothetical protein